MHNFKLLRPKNTDQFTSAFQHYDGEKLIYAGGTDALDLLKERILEPDYVISIKAIPELKGIKETKGGFVIGAATTLEEMIQHQGIAKHFPGLIQAAKSIATPQIRNLATVGGNLTQRPRCWYFRGENYPCLKKGGGMCFAYVGLNKYHAILGGGPCYIVHPSDIAPMLIALDAHVRLLNAKRKTRELPLAQFFQLPSANLYKENVLEEGEIITHIVVPYPSRNLKSFYLKFKERETADFAVVSVALALEISGKRVRKGRVVLGGVAPIPWEVPEAARLLKQANLTSALIDEIARVAVKDAQPLAQNQYKVILTQNLIRKAFRNISQA